MSKRDKYGWGIDFPDGSRGFISYTDLKFFTEEFEEEFVLCQPHEFLKIYNMSLPALITAHSSLIKNLKERIEYPKVEFGSCFRRMSNSSEELVYSHKFKNPPVDVLDINKFYMPKKEVSSGMFSPRMEHYYLCDGEIYYHMGYGFGPQGKSFIQVKGEIALRALCLFFGIKQPNHIKGYPKKLKDSEILYELTETVAVGPQLNTTQEILGTWHYLNTLLEIRLQEVKKAGGTMGHKVGSLKDQQIKLRELFKSL
ncbi:hypothetical protein SLH46_20770 [Draconibacterium sp. IB214405]|uniref:hypothetical protein n=1 Tax=Draconibacterium sp. IB214405 TaxID=3097352 RepID=UPI002A1059DD|nr:hypothetical protein [Draconibacterium sp. IB214405]MDX8341644.1 hypothetical protein [Draconibacterium sp. IB214405]